MAIVSACLPWAPALLEQPVEVERDARQVAEVLEDREEREEDRHRRQHDRDDPRQRPVDAVPDEARDPPGHAGRRERSRTPASSNQKNPAASIGDG